MEADADERGPWHHVPDVFARRADGSALLLDVRTRPGWKMNRFRLQAARTAALCGQLGWDYQMVGEPPAQRWANVSSSCRASAVPCIWARTWFPGCWSWPPPRSRWVTCFVRHAG